MLNYASRFRKHCFRSFILSYFGEWTRNQECGNCSRCSPGKFPRTSKAEILIAPTPVKINPPNVVSTPSDSSTIIALKILSCVLRVHQKLGREKVAKILAGSSDSSIHDYRALSTYGLLSDYSIKSVTNMIDYLISENYIGQEEGFRPSIFVTSKGQVFLRERPAIDIPGINRPA